MVDSQVNFTKVVVIESLPSGEQKTGRELSHRIRLELLGFGETLEVEYVACAGAGDLCAKLEGLRDEANQLGHKPILHIECHGDRESGLHFADGSSMDWEQLAGYLEPINIATGFNLLVLVSACFGAHFLGMMGAVRPCPCWAVIAPTDVAQPTELENGFGDFYRELFRTWNLDEALSTLANRPLSRGAWLCELAERWFAAIFIGYLQNHCRTEHIEARIRELKEKRAEEGLPWVSDYELRRELRRLNSVALDRYFNIYFHTDIAPANAERFATLKQAVEAEVRKLAQSGDFLI